jgi:exonuclease SbcC
MKITSLTLNNFQSYANETIEFDDGVSLLHGDNGSGKSTVLRGIFAGLFQTKMRSHSATQFNSIADLVRKGESEGSVSLTFDVNRTEYTLDWEISVDDPSADEPTGSSESCTLSSPALASPISGITPVRTALTEDILGMDAEAFVNSVYVQQNEVMKLISATESERKKIFDDLLGLSQIDEYIDRTSEVRLGADDKREAAANRRDELQRQLEDDYPDREELEERQRELNSQLRDAKQKRDDLTGKRSDRHDEWEDFDDRIENYGDLEDEQEDLEDDIVTLSAKIDNVREEISTLEDESDDARGEMWEIKGEINEIDGEIDQYDLSESEAAAATEDEANDEFVSANRNETSAASEVESARDDLNEATEEKRDLEEDLANCRDDLREVQKTLETAQERVNEFETALNDAHENRNDTVTSYLPSSPSPDEITQETRSTVEDHIASLDDEREDRRNDLTRVNADLSNAREAVTQLKERVEDASEDRDDVLAALPDDLQTETGASDGGIVATRVDDAEETIEALETVSIEIDFQIRSSIETARDSTIPEARSELDSRYAEVVDTYADLSGQELHLEKRLSEYTQIKRSGNCPVCGEAVADDNDHHIGERDATNDELVEVQCELVDVREERQTLEADQERLDTLRGLVSEILLLSTLHETESKLERLQSDLAEKRGEVETLQEEVGTIGDEVSELTAIVDEGRETILPTFETVETRLD